jgi:hypothetical protein
LEAGEQGQDLLYDCGKIQLANRHREENHEEGQRKMFRMTAKTCRGRSPVFAAVRPALLLFFQSEGACQAYSLTLSNGFLYNDDIQ